MPKVYFISDAHLGLGPKHIERAKEERLLSFLDHIQTDATHLFILGDLFDAWIEYRHVIPKGYHRVLAKLDELVRQGIVVHYLVGNHDFWIRDYFHDEIGMKTHMSAFDIDVNGQKIFLHHGDGLSHNDTGYKILKKILRNRFSVWLYSLVHPDIGVSLARSSSRSSRKRTSTKDFGEQDGMMEFAQRKIEEGYDLVVMGHMHKPIYHEFGSGIYINLGDWITHNTYAEINGTQVTLKQWT